MCSIASAVLTVLTGPGREIYKVGAGGEKGREGGEEKLYCQVVLSAV